MLYIRVAGRIDDRVKYHGGRATRWASGKQCGRQVEQRGRYEVGVGVASWLPDLEEKKKSLSHRPREEEEGPGLPYFRVAKKRLSELSERGAKGSAEEGDTDNEFGEGIDGDELKQLDSVSRISVSRKNDSVFPNFRVSFSASWCRPRGRECSPTINYQYHCRLP